MFFCPEPRSTADREEKVRDQKLNLLSLQRKQLKKKKTKRRNEPNETVSWPLDL